MNPFSSIQQIADKQKEEIKTTTLPSSTPAKPAKPQSNKGKEGGDISNDTVDDIVEGVNEGDAILPEVIDENALLRIIDLLYRYHAGRDQVQVKLSSDELEIVGKFIDSIKTRELEYQSVTIPKLYRYCTMYMIINHPSLVKKSLRSALKKKDNYKIMDIKD